MLINCKKGDHEFLYEVPLATPVEQVISELVNILNTLLRLKRLITYIPDLANHGPQRPPETQVRSQNIRTHHVLSKGLDECLPPEEVERIKASCIPGEAEYCPDPNGQRTGRAPIQAVRETILKTVEEVNNQVLDKVG